MLSKAPPDSLQDSQNHKKTVLAVVLGTSENLLNAPLGPALSVSALLLPFSFLFPSFRAPHRPHRPLRPTDPPDPQTHRPPDPQTHRPLRPTDPQTLRFRSCASCSFLFLSFRAPHRPLRPTDPADPQTPQTPQTHRPTDPTHPDHREGTAECAERLNPPRRCTLEQRVEAF